MARHHLLMEADRPLRLCPLHESAAADVLRFESVNREYFRRYVPDRGDSYFSSENVQSTIDRAAAEWGAGTAFLFLVMEAEAIVGRANLSVTGQVAEVGYRTAQQAAGRGIATRAVGLLVDEARGLSIVRLIAIAPAEHDASQAVLRRNGFHTVPDVVEPLALHGRALEAVRFELALR
jgi:[ribosomal protein S5]-alanine N-acetyltransferase